MAALDHIGPAESVSEQKLELRRIVNLTPQMLSVMEPDGRVTWVNDVALDYLGITLRDLRTSDLQDGGRLHADDLASLPGPPSCARCR